MLILAIETSCDETGIAILRVNKEIKVIANLVASQIELHKPYGGIMPTVAKRAHQKKLPVLLKKINPDWHKIDALAVTIGPGLDPCLWQGINFAKKLAKKHSKKIVAVNHLEAHIYANFIDNPSLVLPLKKKNNSFPALGLIVSGGHTQLVLIKDLLNHQLLGETRDDAAGEAFDKVARLLGLSFPGGPIIEKKAAKIESRIKNYESRIKLPRPMINSQDFDFSFSGLKTAVLYKVEEQKNKQSQLPEKYIQQISYEFQQSVIDVLITKTQKAIKEFKSKTVLFGGGVMANKKLRKIFKQTLSIDYYIPPIKYCTDNAAMIAMAAFFHAKEKDFTPPSQLKSQPNLSLDSHSSARVKGEKK